MEAIKKFIPQNFNDFLAVFIVSAIVVLWVIQGIGKINLSEAVNGALIVTFTLIIQYYFRKKSGGD